MIEDEMFARALNILGLKRTKDMYKESRYPHKCSMCLDNPNMAGYMLKPEFVSDYETPYMFICQECWESLPDKSCRD